MSAPLQHVTLKLRSDPDTVAWLDELRGYLSAFQDAIHRPINIVELIRDLPRGATAFNCVVAPTSRADEHRIVLEPGDAFRDLMTAMRTWNVERDIA